MNLPNRDKIRGIFLGIAIGDALGMPAETYSADEINRRFGFIDRYIKPADDHKWFAGREAGTWTDDTQLSLVVAESLIAKGDIDMDDLAARHVAALNETDLGWGPSTREAVRWLEAGVHWSESAKRVHRPKASKGLGNGVVMKLGPLAVFICLKYNQPNNTNTYYSELRDFTYMTHHSLMASTASMMHTVNFMNCLLDSPSSFDRERFIRNTKGLAVSPPNDLVNNFQKLRVYDDVREIIVDFGGGTSYVANSLPFSYAFFLRHPTNIQSLYEVVSAGGDTDSNGSIVGSLLGALNGASIFPQHLVDGLWQKDRILDTAEIFCDRFRISS